MVSWGYGDFTFRQDFDNVSSTIKVRQAGFHECLDSETMFSQFFEKLREMKLLSHGNAFGRWDKKMQMIHQKSGYKMATNKISLRRS
jgi:hypothetical protein